ncbi:MAG: hypothetical protein J7L11_10410 [Thermoprotei archaeon]|nr:hypothetical protein [Thermoprotei archaeon]
MPQWVRTLLLGVGLGILAEALIFLSPLFETTLWKTFCTFVKIIPLMVLYVTITIGIALIGIGLLLGRKRL